MFGGSTPGQEAVQYPRFVHVLSLSTSVAHQGLELPSMVVQVVCKRWSGPSGSGKWSRKEKMQLAQLSLSADVELSAKQSGRDTRRRRRRLVGGIPDSCRGATGGGGGIGKDIPGRPTGIIGVEGSTP